MSRFDGDHLLLSGLSLRKEEQDEGTAADGEEISGQKEGKVPGQAFRFLLLKSPLSPRYLALRVNPA